MQKSQSQPLSELLSFPEIVDEQWIWSDHRALITGGASGIGKSITIALVNKGAHVTVLDKDEEQLRSLKDIYPQIEIRNVNLRNWKETEEAVKSILPIDLLVNNVGIGSLEPINEITEDKYNNIFDLNVKTYFNVTNVVTSYLMKHNLPGAIVNISSIATLVFPPNSTLYSASKSAINGFTKALAQELGPYRIRVNSVCPGLVKTTLSRGVWENSSLLNTVIRRTPLGRATETTHIADAVVFLLSDQSRLITGTCLPVDGGHSVSF